MPPSDQKDPAQAQLLRLANELMPLFYADLQRIARHQRRRVSAGETLQTTALIHEAYLKMANSQGFADHAHFLRASAMAMRHVLINHIRERMADKRGGGAFVESLTAASGIAVDSNQALVDVHEALEQLASMDPRLVEVVECRFFAGYSEQETALALGVTDRTVRRDWSKARAWLRYTLQEQAHDNRPTP